MKRKLFIVLISFLTCLCCIIPFAGCGSDDSPKLPSEIKNGEWIEVYNITYFINSFNGTHTSNELKLESSYELERDTEQVSQSEYDNASAEQKYFDLPSTMINRKAFITKLKQWIEKPYYFFDGSSCFKTTIKSYKIKYIRVRFLNDNCIEINDSNKTIRVLPLSYSITYFND